MLFQVIVKFDPRLVNYKDIEATVTGVGVDLNDIKMTTCREVQPKSKRNSAGGRKGATSATSQDAS